MTKNIIGQLGANSAIYAATNMLQKGTAFLLMPLYTLYLDPAAFGVLSVVTSINGLLGIAFTLSLTSAVTRFYFEHRDDPVVLAEFWGTMLCFVLLLSLVLAAALLLVGDRLLAPFIGGVAFWPYVALGVLATVFQPFFTTFLAVLQSRNEATRFAIVSLSHFGLTTILTIALVVALGWGATGALSATLAGAAVFFVVSLWMLRRDLRLCLKWVHLRPALAYSLPQLPHTAASQIGAITDRLVLNARLGTSAAGLYSVGSMLAMVVEIIAQSVNRAYVPLSMAALKSRSPSELAQLRAIGALVVASFCLLGTIVSAFSSELLWLLAAPAFAPAADVVPLLAFAGVSSSAYYLFVNILFFDRSATRLIALGTVSAALLNVVLVFLLAPTFGLKGAACAALISQSVAAVLVAWIGARFDPVDWDYARYAAAIGLSLACAVWAGGLSLATPAWTWAAKLACVAGVAAGLGALFWRSPLIFAVATGRLLQRRFADAAALFIDERAAA